MRDADIAKIKRDDDALDELLNDNAFRYEKMPDIFSKGAVIADAKGSNAKVLAILKRDLGHRTILKMAIEKNGGTLWSIAKDDYGLPKYRVLHSHCSYRL